MAQAFYPAVIDKDPDSDYGVTFPDFPGCVSAGSTIEEAVRMATEALALHVVGIWEEGKLLPSPRLVEAITIAPEVSVVCVTMIPVKIPGRTKRINITIDEALLARIDAVSENRSGFLSDAARRALEERSHNLSP